MEGTKKSRLPWKCVFLCMVVSVVPAVEPERAKAEGIIGADTTVSSAYLIPSPYSSLSFTTEPQQQGHVRAPQGQQLTTQSDTMQGPYVKEVASSCGASTSFGQLSINAEEDVSCFPHDKNIGSQATTVTLLYRETVQECLKECRKSETCTHYTYNKNSKACHMKDAAPDFYTYVGDMTGPRSCDSTCFVSCLTYNTNPMRTLQHNNAAPSLCQAACAATNDCQAFLWTESDCKLFPSGFAAHRSVNKDNSLAGPRFLCEDGTGSDLRFREASNGNYLGQCLLSDDVGSRTPELPPTTEASSILACQQRCASNNRCSHYTYNADSKKCFLKEGAPNYYRYPNDATGARDCVPT